MDVSVTKFSQNKDEEDPSSGGATAVSYADAPVIIAVMIFFEILAGSMNTREAFRQRWREFGSERSSFQC